MSLSHVQAALSLPLRPVPLFSGPIVNIHTGTAFQFPSILAVWSSTLMLMYEPGLTPPKKESLLHIYSYYVDEKKLF